MLATMCSVYYSTQVPLHSCMCSSAGAVTVWEGRKEVCVVPCHFSCSWQCPPLWHRKTQQVQIPLTPCDITVASHILYTEFL